MNTLEQNEYALGRLGETFKKNYCAIKEQENQNAFITETVDGQKIICQQRQGYCWRLNSIYQPEVAAEKYVNKIERFKDYSVICVFGLSDGKVIRKLCKKCNGTQNMVIYEPDTENFILAMQNFPLEDILEKNWVHLIVDGINGTHLVGKLDELINYENRNLVTECILPNYDVLYGKQGQDYIDKMLYCVKKHVFNMNTEVAYGKKLADNILYNLPYIIQQSSLYNLKSKIDRYDISDVPAVIVSAGPSLDKNIKQLKEIGNKAFIIAVDSALKALLNEGVRYHIGISIDPRKNPATFEDDRIADYPLLLSANSIPIIAKQHRNRMFFQSPIGFEGFEEQIKNRTGKGLGELKTGGSVATDAFSLARYLGFRTIILVGQDLAYTGGQTHVKGFAENEDNKRKEEDLVEVEGIDGNKLVTDIQMASYREWFELQIQRYAGRIVVYNATEGGARIHGAKELSLQDAIGKLCCREVDFPIIIQDAPRLFAEEDRATVINVFSNLDEYFAELKKQIRVGKDAYNTLIYLEDTNGQGSELYQQVIRQISDVNKLDEQEPYMNFIKCYAKQDEYKAAEDIYVAQDLTIKEIAERGARLLEGYEKGVDIAIEQVQKILKPALKEGRSN